MELDRKNLDYAEKLSTPREQCKTCYEWLTQECVGKNDSPHCTRSDYECRYYLDGSIDECPFYLNL